MGKGRYELGRPRFHVVIAFDDAIIRSSVCEYPLKCDCLDDLSFSHFVRFAESGWLRKWGADPALREFVQGNIVLYGTWGFVKQVEQFVQGRADQGGYRFKITLPRVSEDEVHLFILGACRVPDEE